jgi:hypothetical protein
MHITWAVLEAAKDAGDEMVVAACRRIIVAERVGWRRHGNPADRRPTKTHSLDAIEYVLH